MTINHALETRQATHNDIDGMLALLKQLFSIEADFRFDATKQRAGLTRLINDSEKDDPRAMVLVVTVNDQIIAMCSCQILISTAEGGNSGLVEDVIVDKAFRNQGIGQQLMKHLLSWAKTQGIKRLQLLADNNNAAAISFYHHNGWQSTNLSALFKTL